MNDQELKKELENVKSKLKLFDDIVHMDFEEEDGEVKNVRKINKRQAKAVQELLDLFQRLNWQLALNSYKELKTKRSETILTKDRCGKPVKIRSCREEHGDKTYFGILLGDVAREIHHSIDKEGNLTARKSLYNPAIFIPELGDIVYGCESWWGEIESEEELDKLITDESIQKVWYVKLLKQMTENKKPSSDSGD